MTDLVLHQFPGAYGMESLSPFCTKLASYLQLAGVPHERRLGDPREAPRGKLPYVRWDGALLGDSQLIIERCQTELGDPLDGRLDAEAKALGHLLRRAAEDHLYWALLAMRWGDDDVWRASYRDAIAGALPKGTGWFLPGLIRRGVVKSLHHHGLGRHSRETVDAQGIADLDAVAAAMRGDFCSATPRRASIARSGPWSSTSASPPRSVRSCSTPARTRSSAPGASACAPRPRRRRRAMGGSPRDAISARDETTERFRRPD